MARPDPATLSLSAPAGFSARVRDCFGRGAAGYERGARLQAAIANRLGGLSRQLAAEIPAGARADLGAGSGVPFSGLALPDAEGLAAVAGERLRLRRLQRLRFSRPNRGGLALLRQIKAIGAQASPQRRLSPTELRRLLRHWPGPEQPLNWEVLLVVGQR